MAAFQDPFRVGCAVQMKHARELKRNHQEIIPKDTTDRELFKKAGRSAMLTVWVHLSRSALCHSLLVCCTMPTQCTTAAPLHCLGQLNFSYSLQTLLALRRSHSRLQNIEFECWVFKGSLPSEARLTELGIEKDNAYYSRITFDPKTLDKLP